MSIVKRFEIQCDRCRFRREWSHELVANACGITKGGGIAELRAEARAVGWQRRQVKPGVWIDLCFRCSALGTPRNIWFQRVRDGE